MGVPFKNQNWNGKQSKANEMTHDESFHQDLRCLLRYMYIGLRYIYIYWIESITKTYLYNFDPLKPHFYTVKLEFTGVYIIFLMFAQKHRL